MKSLKNAFFVLIGTLPDWVCLAGNAHLESSGSEPKITVPAATASLDKEI